MWLSIFHRFEVVVVCTSLAVVVLTWLLTWLTKRVELVELAWLAIVAPRSPSAVAKGGSVAPESLSSIPHNVSLSSCIVIDVDLTSHPIALTSSQNSPICLSCSEFAANR